MQKSSLIPHHEKELHFDNHIYVAIRRPDPSHASGSKLEHMIFRPDGHGARFMEKINYDPNTALDQAALIMLVHMGIPHLNAGRVFDRTDLFNAWQEHREEAPAYPKPVTGKVRPTGSPREDVGEDLNPLRVDTLSMVKIAFWAAAMFVAMVYAVIVSDRVFPDMAYQQVQSDLARSQ